MKINLPGILLIIFSVFFQKNTFSEKLNSNYEKVLKELLNMKIDTVRTGSIEKYTLTREAGSYFFESGIVYPCKPINGKTRAAVFVGKGIFNYNPPLKIEQDQLARFYEKRNLKSEFEYVFMLFGDSTFEELEKHFQYENINNYDNAEDVIKETLRFVSDKDKNFFESYLIKAVLEDRQNGFFFSGFEDEDSRLMFYEVDPFSPEEIKLHEGHLEGFNRRTRLDNVNSFDAASDKINNEQKYNDFIDIEKYILDVTIEDDADFSASAEILFLSKTENQKYLNFLMYHKLEIDSVFFQNKKHNKFYKPEDNANLWIEFEDELKTDSLYSIKVFYSGDVLERNLNAWFYLKTSGGWFPRYGTRKYSNYELTFKYPSTMDLLSVGEKIYESEIGSVKFSRWATKDKIRNASFNIGTFKTFEYNEDGIPNIKVYHSKYGHRGSVKGIENEVGEDVVNAVKFFRDTFGEIESDSLTVTEIPFYHGEAFPDLIHLSFVTFTNTRYNGFDEKFRGHEVAHQWWGINVDFETYHDQWLSEGFAEYSGLMFLQNESENDKKFNTILEEYKDEIINNRKQIFWEGQEAGPIYLGIRTSGKETEGDYNLIIYRKGAWVLHMLRMMLTDHSTKDDSKFKNMMKEYFQTYKGNKANTAGFQKIVHKHFNENMDWFFNQWVYDTFIPFYQFAYETEKTENATYKIKCKTALENSYPEHKTIVPILIKAEDERFERFFVKLEGDKTEFELPPVSFEPDEIIFDDLNSVLCEVDYVDWDDIE